MERILQGILLSGLILFFTLAPWALVEDWQAWAAVNHPELQWRGMIYAPEGYRCVDMLTILGNPDTSEYWPLRESMKIDFDTLAAHGYNLIRIYYTPKVDSTDGSPACTLLMPDSGEFCAMDTLLAMLDEAGLKLYVSLTGIRCWEDTSCCRQALLDTTGDHPYRYRYQAWLDSFLTEDKGYANNPTIVAWDLRQQGSMEDTACNDWARVVLPFLQDTLDSTTQVTRALGCAHPGRTDSVRAIGDFDFYDWHAYLRSSDQEEWYWTPLPESVAAARGGSMEHTLSFGEFGYRMDDTNGMTEMEQRELFRNFFYKSMELGIGHGLIWRMYDRDSVKRYPGIYREDRSFKPAGELIAQIFEGEDWGSMPIVGNWHMELDDRDNWEDQWPLDSPTCWRTKVWPSNTYPPPTFTWDTLGDYNHTPTEAFPNPRASLKIVIGSSEPCTCSWYYKCDRATTREHIAVMPGVSYGCSAWVWREGEVDSVWLGIRWFSREGKRIADSLGGWVTGSSGQWDRIGFSCISPDGENPTSQDAYSCIVSCNLKASEPCSVWFDDVQLYEGLRWKTYWPDTVVVEIGEGGEWDTTLLMADDGQYYTISAEDTSDGVWRTEWYGEVKIGEGRDAVRRLWVGYDGHYSTGDVENPKVQRIYLLNWTAEPDTWDLLCATADDSSCWNLIRRADITHGWSTADEDDILDYINPDGYIQLQVVTEDTAAYDCLADYMRFSVEFVSD